MRKSITIKPINSVRGIIRLPGSKSISSRVLLLAAQSKGVTKLTNLLNSDDIRYMLLALKQLGISYQLSSQSTICKIYGIGGVLQSKCDDILFLGNSGTAMRFLTAALCIQTNRITLTGELRMQERPINHLIESLQQGGSIIKYLRKDNFPPIEVFGGYKGGSIILNGKISSQFLSAMLMMAPLAQQDTHIIIDGVLVSRPYIDMTLSLMKIFGITINNNNYRDFYIQGNRLYQSPINYEIEGDASNASYFLAAAAVGGGPVRVIGINKHSIQGDVYFAKVLEKMGAIIKWGDNYIECIRHNLVSIDMDMNYIPDVAMTVAILALFTKQGTTTVLRNIYNWRVKETDRLKAMTNELRKTGALVLEGYDYLSITAPIKILSKIIHTYNDHRMAMCFSLLALSSDCSVTILEPDCVNKTFPNFFKYFSTIIN